MEKLEKKVNYFSDKKTIKKEYYVNDRGQAHGLYKDFYMNRQIDIECTYVNKNLYGSFKRYYSNGQIHTIRQFKKNDLHGIKIDFKH